VARFLGQKWKIFKFHANDDRYQKHVDSQKGGIFKLTVMERIVYICAAEPLFGVKKILGQKCKSV
jgi:hypothetical protein